MANHGILSWAAGKRAKPFSAAHAAGMRGPSSHVTTPCTACG
jgi:hypothetical protein